MGAFDVEMVGVATLLRHLVACNGVYG